jgi:hypothetical protein
VIDPLEPGRGLGKGGGGGFAGDFDEGGTRDDGGDDGGGGGTRDDGGGGGTRDDGGGGDGASAGPTLGRSPERVSLGWPGLGVIVGRRSVTVRHHDS